MKKIIDLIITVSILCTLTCTTKLDYDAEKESVKSTIQQHLNSNATEDADLYVSSWAEDDEMVNFDPWQRYVGWKELKAHAIEQYELLDNIKFSTRDLVINLNTSGNTAWFSCYLDFSGTLGGENMIMEGLRFTGVLIKQNNKWVYVQTHTSLASSS